MNKLTWICVSAMILSSAACGVKDHSDIATRYAKIKALNKGAADSKAQAGTCTPSSAGVISLGGVLIEGKDAGRVKTVVSRSFGKAGAKMSGKTDAVFSSMSAPLTETLQSLDDAGKTDKYINLGCSPADLPQSGTSIPATALGKDLSLTAVKTLFICGKISLPEGTYNLAADRVVLKDVSLLMIATSTKPAQLSMLANSIELNGTNEIKIKAADGANLTQDEANVSLSLNIIKEVTNSGSLLLNSEGADCVTADSAKAVAPSTTPAATNEKSATDTDNTGDMDNSASSERY